MAKRIYLNRSDEPAPEWLAPVETALRAALDASRAAESALVQALIDNAGNPDVATVLADRLDRLGDAMSGGAAYGPFAGLVRTEWTGGDSFLARNHKRYIGG